MNIFHNPGWISKQHLNFKTVADVPDALYEEINRGLADLQQHEAPVVSIVIPAWNEEVNIVRTLYSLSKNRTSYPTEIIIVNNNSTDQTQQVLDRLAVKSLFQPVEGCGPARQLGQENARGKYILLADADCFYPPSWIQKMIKALSKPGVVCVYGRYSFLGTHDKPRWQFFLYERLRDVLAEIRHIKRPYLNSLGMSMGYIKELGLAKGFVQRKIRGEDGRMCFELMEFGKVKQVRNHAIRVWTLPRTLDKEGGTLMQSLLTRVALELGRFKNYFKKEVPHDTKTSENYSPATTKLFQRFKEIKKEQNSDSAKHNKEESVIKS